MPKLFTVLFSLVAATASAGPINLVANGDFSAGATGFSTDYTQGTGGFNSLWDPGTFDVSNSIGDLHSLWTVDPPDGNFLLVNGRTDDESLVWGQSIATTPGQTYKFSVSAANLCCKPGSGGDQFPPLLRFLINGNIFGLGLTDGPGHWDVLEGFFTADSVLSTLSIRDESTAYGGNDFGLDNIVLEPVPEPASLVMLGTGLFAAVWKRRRR